MESYGIQHDFLFASKDVAADGPPCFDDPSNVREESLAIAGILGFLTLRLFYEDYRFLPFHWFM